MSAQHATSKGVLPLSGRRFLIARTAEGNETEREKLEALGASTVCLTSIEFSPPSSWGPLDRAIERIQEFDWIVFTSPNGVRFFFERLNGSPHSKLNARFACVGPATLGALERLGMSADLVPREFLTERLGEELARLGILEKKILLPKAEVANRRMPEILRDGGAIVVEVPVYRTIPAKLEGPPRHFLEGVTDITLTSPSTAKGLLSMIPVKDIMAKGIEIHCIGPVTSKKASDFGLRVSTIAKVHTIDGLIDSIIQKLEISGREMA